MSSIKPRCVWQCTLRQVKTQGFSYSLSPFWRPQKKRMERAEDTGMKMYTTLLLRLQALVVASVGSISQCATIRAVFVPCISIFGINHPQVTLRSDGHLKVTATPYDFLLVSLNIRNHRKVNTLMTLVCFL